MKSLRILCGLGALCLIGGGLTVLSPFQSHRVVSGAATEYFSLEHFTIPPITNVGFGLVPIDFDHDGDLDIIIVDHKAAADPSPFAPCRLVVMRNDGQGHFKDATKAVLNNAETEMGGGMPVVADFDEDGRQDLYIPLYGNDRVPWLGAQNQIFFQSPHQRLIERTRQRLPPMIDCTWNVAVGDIDKDGDLDIYVCNGGPITSYPYFLINNGKGAFTLRKDNLPQSMTHWGYWWDEIYMQSALVDVDKDGDLDLIVGHEINWPDVSLELPDRILLNDGKGVFTYAPLDYLPVQWGGKGAGTPKILSADFNNDGWPDLVMYSGTYEKVRHHLLLNQKNGKFKSALSNLPPISGGPEGNPLVAVDFNNDGLMDIFDNYDSEGPLIFLNKGNAKFTTAQDILLPKEKEGWFPFRAYPFDMDNDGDIDIVAASPGVGWVYRNLKPYKIKK